MWGGDGVRGEGGFGQGLCVSGVFGCSSETLYRLSHITFS